MTDAVERGARALAEEFYGVGWAEASDRRDNLRSEARIVLEAAAGSEEHDEGDLFAPHRWWRVSYSDKRGGIQVWCETSDEDEARVLLSTCPGEPVLERLYRCTASEWRVQQ